VPEETASARQRFNKHVSAATDMHATIGELLETMSSMWSSPKLYSKDEQGKLAAAGSQSWLGGHELQLSEL
jgi:hypothetical protein